MYVAWYVNKQLLGVCKQTITGCMICKQTITGKQKIVGSM